MTTLTVPAEITVREPQLRLAQEEALTALGWVLNCPAGRARARLRFGPGRTCEQLARMVDTALVRAEELGMDTGDLVLAMGSAAIAEDIVRVRRKAHGLSDWISSPTSDVTIVLRPQGAASIDPLAQPVRVTAATAVAAVTPAEPESPAERAVREVLYGVLDPDLGVNVVDLGFVRKIKVDDAGQATITMTLTSPACPLAKVMTNQMRTMLSEVNADFKVEWEWQPSWRPDEITPAGRAIGFNAFKPQSRSCFRAKPIDAQSDVTPARPAGAASDPAPRLAFRLEIDRRPSAAR